MKRIAIVLVSVTVLAFGLQRSVAFLGDFDATQAIVGQQTNGFETPDNQRVTPVGIFVQLPGVRPNALALSPNGKVLVTSGLTRELLVIDPATGRILQRVPFPRDNMASTTKAVSSGILNPNAQAKLSFTGLTFSPDGSRIYLSNVNGDIKVFAVDHQGRVSPFASIPLPPANKPGRKNALPTGIAVSRDGHKLYVALNVANQLAEVDTKTGKMLRKWNVGVAPYGVVLCRNKIYVSNWGGRRPDANSRIGPIGINGTVRVDARYIASEGSVSVIDLGPGAQSVRCSGKLASPRQAKENRIIPMRSTVNSAPLRNGAALPEKEQILTGRHACALAFSRDGKFLACANAGEDTVSIIDTRSDTIVETICARQRPGDPFGAQPNALAFDDSGNRLYVCNGTQNAVAVFQFKHRVKWLGLFPVDRYVPGKTKMLGLIPVGWFPGGIAYDARWRMLDVANIKSISPKEEEAGKGKGHGLGYNTKQFYGSLSLVPVPSQRDLKMDTRKSLADLRYPLLAQAKLPPRKNQPARPVPERVGEPSVFRHVIYIIKENRTYDQVLGDVKRGNGEANLCIFGERVTPNEHKFVRDFVLLDNTYCSGILSADGHQWTDTGIATDYVEREFAGWPRSYPAGGRPSERDALAYSSAGFVWNDAVAHGKSVCDFGEFTTTHRYWRNPGHRRSPQWLDCYHDFLSRSNAIGYSAEPNIEALRPYLQSNYPGFDLNIPDVLRASRFIRSLKQFEAAGHLPNLVIVWLPNDHTSGTRFGSPTPAAQVADNDLAFGQIVQAVSHSRFWTNTCIFAVEDDPQDGWDHVSGYRTTAYLISPYTKRHAVVDTQYNQTSLLRTIELILGLPPMNQMDATATPMFDCFTSTPDFTSYQAVTNTVPLDEMNPSPNKIKDALLRKDADTSARLPLQQEDQCPEDLFNHILWRAAKGSKPERFR